MSLADDLKTPPLPGNAKTQCQLTTEIAKVKKAADRNAFLAALDDQRWSGRILSTVLAKHGMTVSGNLINKHRAGQCSCFRNREAEQ